jgi:hypothetical protein
MTCTESKTFTLGPLTDVTVICGQDEGHDDGGVHSVWRTYDDVHVMFVWSSIGAAAGPVRMSTLVSFR